MAWLMSLLEHDSDRQPPTVVTQATTWWETVHALVKLKEIGLGVHLAVKVCYKKAISFLSYLCAYIHICIWFLYTVGMHNILI